MRRGDNSDDNAGNSRARGEPSVSSPQRPTCSRRRPYIPAAVPAQWLRLMIFSRPDIKCSHHMGGVRITISRQDRHFSLGAPHRPIAFRFHKSLLFLVNFFHKIACQLKSVQSRVSAAKYMLIRNLYGSPGLSRTDALPRGLWFGKEPPPVPNGQGRRLRSLRRLRYMRGTARAPCASGPAGCRADRGIWRWSGEPPRSHACPSR